VETRSHSTLLLLLPPSARQKMLRDENLSARETVRRIPATSVTLFREASVEDACDMEASSQKPPIDRMVHGNFAYRHPLPHVPRCLGHCANGLVREVVGRGRGRRWKHFLPSFSSSRLLLLPPSSPRLLLFRVPPLSPDVTSYFRVRPRLQVRLLPSDLSASSEFTCAVWIQPARLRPSVHSGSVGEAEGRRW